MEDFQTYQNVMEDFSQKSDEDLDRWEDEAGFVSLRARNIALSADTTSNMLLPEFDFPTFYSTLINQKGELQVGDTILFFANKKAYLIPQQDESKLRNSNGVFDTTLFNNISSQRVFSEIVSPREFFGTYQREYGGNFKFVIELVRSNIPGFSLKILRFKNEQWVRRCRFCWSFNWRPSLYKGNHELTNFLSMVQYVRNGIPQSIKTIDWTMFNPTIVSTSQTQYSQIDVVLDTWASNALTSMFLMGQQNNTYWRSNINANSIQVNLTQPHNLTWRISNPRWYFWQ